MNRLPRIGIFESKTLNGVSLWRSVRPWTDLFKAGAVELEFYYESIQEQEFYKLDVIYLAHVFDERILRLIEGAQLGGCLVWVDLDDDLEGVGIHNQKAHTIKKDAPNVRKILAAANIVSFSTTEIQEKYQQFCKVESVVLPNSVHRYEVAPEWNGGDRVLWRGNFTQSRDMWVNKGDHDRMLEKGLKFVYAGLPPSWVEDPRWVEWGPTHSYFKALRDGKASFFWKPLEDLPFNHCKSNIAMLEGAMAGALTVTNFKDPKWLPAIDLQQLFGNDEKWMRKRYQQMIEFIFDGYDAAKVGESRYNHLIKSLGK